MANDKLTETSLMMEEYLEKAYEQYQIGDGSKLYKMGFHDNVPLAVDLEVEQLRNRLLKTQKFKPIFIPDAKGQYQLLHLDGCCEVLLASAGKEWDYAKEAGFKTDIGLSPTSQSIILKEKLSIEKVASDKDKNKLDWGKSAFLAFYDLFSFFKNNKIPARGVLQNERGVAIEITELVYNP